MKGNIFYSLLTQYRLQLFGIALLWIFYRHTYYYNTFTFGILDFIVQIGDCGVDIFLFLSGFGLYYSYQKYNNVIHFYQKRLLRIIPSVIVLLLFFALIDVLFYDHKLSRLISPTYWFFSIYSKYWFIGAILFFYLLYPFVYKTVLHHNHIITIIGSIFIAISGIILIQCLDIQLLKQLVVYIARFPVFLLGSIFAKKIEWFENKYIILLLFILSIPLIYILPKDFQRLSYCFISLGFIYIMIFIVSKLPKFINQLIGILGIASLEFYLIHIYIFSNNGLGITYAILHSEILTSIFLLIIICIFAILTNKLIAKITLSI